MYINFKFLLSVLSAVLLLSFVMPIFSFEPSGGVLMLDGEDDYAILPLAEHGYIFPKNTEAFTAEVWFYPKSQPEPGQKDIILSQQVVFGLSGHLGSCRGWVGKKNEVCSYGTAHLEGGARGVTSASRVIKKDQWNYLAIIFKDSTFHLVYNDQIVRGQKRAFMNVVAAKLFFVEQFNDFFVGGFAEDKVIINQFGALITRETYFHGAIDAIRFSNIARYDLPAELGTSPFDPPQRFLNDEHTLALWDFNEKEGADRFEDTSGNEKTLIGMNGAAVMSGGDVGNLEIRPDRSLAITWGQVKSELF